MSESRLQRWSRRKNETRNEAEAAPVSTVEPELSPEEQELAVNEALPESEVLAKYDLPDPDAIELGTDITGFMRKEIPEFLRRRALRALWRSNPVLAVLDGLNDYDEDYTDAAHVGSVVKTLYKVGQGFIDRTAKADASIEEQTETIVTSVRKPGTLVEEESIDKNDPQVDEQLDSLTDVATETATEKSATERSVEKLDSTRYYETMSTETEAEQTPRYRPRMDFRF